MQPFPKSGHYCYLCARLKWNKLVSQSLNISNNLKTGEWIAYYENGSVFSVGHYDKGRKDGIWTTYSPVGIKVSQVKYFKGKKYEGWMYDMEGNLVEKRIFKDYITND